MIRRNVVILGLVAVLAVCVTVVNEYHPQRSVGEVFNPNVPYDMLEWFQQNIPVTAAEANVITGQVWRPSIGVMAYHSATQAIPAGGLGSAMVFNTNGWISGVTHDVSGTCVTPGTDVACGQFVLSVPGNYLVFCGATWDVQTINTPSSVGTIYGATTNATRQLLIFDGTGTAAHDNRIINAQFHNSQLKQSTTGRYRVGAGGATLTCIAFQNPPSTPSPAALNIIAGSNSNAPFAAFSAIYLGP